MFNFLLPNGYTEVDIGRMQRWIKPDVDILMQRHIIVMGIAKLFWSTWILQGAHIHIYSHTIIFISREDCNYLFILQNYIAHQNITHVVYTFI